MSEKQMALLDMRRDGAERVSVWLLLAAILIALPEYQAGNWLVDALKSFSHWLAGGLPQIELIAQGRANPERSMITLSLLLVALPLLTLFYLIRLDGHELARRYLQQRPVRHLILLVAAVAFFCSAFALAMGHSLQIDWHAAPTGFFESKIRALVETDFGLSIAVALLVAVQAYAAAAALKTLGLAVWRLFTRV